MVPTVFDPASARPPLTPATMFTSWVFDPVALIVVLALGAGYALALRRTGSQRPRARAVFFFSGLALLVVVTMSFLGAYSGVLFWVRAVQNVLLLMTVPLLLALGAPVSLLHESLSERAGERLMTLIRSRAAYMLTFPGVITILLVGTPFMLYLTPLYEATLRFTAVDEVMHLVLLCVGSLYFWTRLRSDPTPREDPHLVSLWITIMEVVFDGALGLVLWLGPLRAPDHYLALARTWGPDPRMDQVLGAGVLWIGGDIAGLPFAMALFRQWKRDDDRHAARIDREIDAGRHTEQSPGGNGLWWENDPQLAERFRHR